MHGSVRGKESRGSLRGLRAGPASFPRPPAAGSRFPPSLQLLGGGVKRSTLKVSGKNTPSLVSSRKSAGQGPRGRRLAERLPLQSETRCPGSVSIPFEPWPTEAQRSFDRLPRRHHVFAACTGSHPGNCRASYLTRPTETRASAVAEDRLVYVQ
jgi:hypothetical protein